jgi:hypothetical protein
MDRRKRRDIPLMDLPVTAPLTSMIEFAAGVPAALRRRLVELVTVVPEVTYPLCLGASPRERRRVYAALDAAIGALREASPEQ